MDVGRRRFVGQAAGLLVSCGMCGQACGALAGADFCEGAVCGIWCGACPAMLESRGAEKASDAKCLGCGSAKKRPEYASKCEVKKCARGRKVASCGLCKHYPCDKIKGFFNDTPKYGLREKYLGMVRDEGVAAWEEAMKKRWQCGKCEAAFGYGAKKCPSCGGAVYTDAEEFAAFKGEKGEGTGKKKDGG